MSFPYIWQGDNITIFMDGEAHTINKTHVCYDRLKEAVKIEDWDTVRELLNPRKVVLNYGQGNVAVKGDVLYWKDQPLHNSLSVRMIKMLQEGHKIDRFVLFMEKLMTNPSKRAVTELYSFLEKGMLPICEDGDFLAYKKVRHDYKDVHSGTIDNSVGQIVEMERNQVDDDKNRTCSSGLHFCSKSYLNHFGGSRVMVLKINPRDVVSIPADYNDSKGRCCRYEVIAELGAEQNLEGTVPDKTLDTVKNVVADAARVQQEYDSRGRPLSMTKDAIRKRLARRAAAGRK